MILAVKLNLVCSNAANTSIVHSILSAPFIGKCWAMSVGCFGKRYEAIGMDFGQGMGV